MIGNRTSESVKPTGKRKTQPFPKGGYVSEVINYREEVIALEFIQV